MPNKLPGSSPGWSTNKKGSSSVGRMRALGACGRRFKSGLPYKIFLIVKSKVTSFN